MSDSNELTIIVEKVCETKEFGTNGFRKRELIGNTEGEYPSVYLFEFANDKADLLDDIQPNDKVTVHYNTRCRRVEKEGKDDMFFTSLSGWRIEK